MNDETFELTIVTPHSIASRQVASLRLKDRTGFFGVMKNHCDFLAVLVPAVGYYSDAAGEHFLAVEGGIFRMREGAATLTSEEVFESDDAGHLAEKIDADMAQRDASELAISRTVEGIERSFLEKTAALSRNRQP